MMLLIYVANLLLFLAEEWNPTIVNGNFQKQRNCGSHLFGLYILVRPWSVVTEWSKHTNFTPFWDVTLILNGSAMPLLQCAIWYQFLAKCIDLKNWGSTVVLATFFMMSFHWWYNNLFVDRASMHHMYSCFKAYLITIHWQLLQQL